MDLDLPFFLPLPPVATFSANVGLVLPAVAFFSAEDFVSVNAGFLISSKDEDEEVSASLQISAESFIWSCSLPLLLVVYVMCLLLLVGGGEGDGDGDGARLHHFEVDCPLLHATFIIPHLTHAHT